MEEGEFFNFLRLQQENALDEILSIDTTSFAKIMLIYYLLVCNNFSTGLVGEDMKKFLKNNKFTENIITFLILYLFISVYIKNTGRVLLYSILGYLWFIFTLQLSYVWNIISLSVIFITFGYEYYVNDKELQELQKKNLSAQAKKEATEDILESKNYVVIVIVVLIMISMIMYYFTNLK